MTTTSTARRLVAVLASVVFITGTYALADGERITQWKDVFAFTVICGVPALAAALIWSRRLFAQIAARACWWVYLLTGTLLAAALPHRGAHCGTFAAACAAVALLAVGRTGLDPGTAGRFQPVAFRGTLLLSLVLAIADGLSLFGYGAVTIGPGEELGKGIVLVALGGLVSLGVVGLLRLRTWGLLVALASNILVAVLALTGALPLPDLLRKLFAVTAILQLVVPLPMLVTILRRRAPGPDRWQRVRSGGATVAILGFAAFSVYAGLIRTTSLIK